MKVRIRLHARLRLLRRRWSKFLWSVLKWNTRCRIKDFFWQLWGRHYYVVVYSEELTAWYLNEYGYDVIAQEIFLNRAVLHFKENEFVVQGIGANRQTKKAEVNAKRLRWIESGASPRAYRVFGTPLLDAVVVDTEYGSIITTDGRGITLDYTYPFRVDKMGPITEHFFTHRGARKRAEEVRREARAGLYDLKPK